MQKGKQSLVYALGYLEVQNECRLVLISDKSLRRAMVRPTWQPLRVLDPQHERKQREMIKARKQSIKHSFETDNGHPCNSKVEVKHHNRRQQKEQKSKQDGSNQELVEIVVARIDTVP